MKLVLSYICRMFQKRKSIFFVLMVIIVMITGYGLNSQLQEVPYRFEMPSENHNTIADFQSDCDSPENGNSNHVSHLISIIERGPASFAIKNPVLLNSYSFGVWQPPKIC